MFDSQKWFPEAARLLRVLCAIPAPQNGERARARFIRDYWGDPAYIDREDNVVLPLGDCQGAVDIFMAHTDTVFPDTTPLPLREEGGVLYCPGAGDDSANLAILLVLGKYALDVGRAGRGVVLCANSGEEGLGNLRGCRALMKAFEGRVRQVVSFDCTLGTLITGCVGSERYEVMATTPGGHSYMDFGRPNAINALARLVTALYDQPLPQIEGARATYNVGTISGGTSVNAIAQSATMKYEIRSDSRECLRQMRKTYRALIDAPREPGARVTDVLLGERPCGGAVDAARQNALAEECARAIASVTGLSCERVAASTDCNIPLSMGVPAVCLGLYEGGGMHTREEWVRVSSLKNGLEIAASLILPRLRP